MKLLTIITSFLSGYILFILTINNVQAIDSGRYIQIANATIQEANSGFIPDIDQLIKNQRILIKIGIAGCEEHIKEHPEHAAFLEEIIANAENMMTLSLQEIETNWHQGAHMRSKGFDIDKLDHFSAEMGLMEAIIHPVTAYISLREYKRTREMRFLSRVSAELIEVVEHVSHITPVTVLTRH